MVLPDPRARPTRAAALVALLLLGLSGEARAQDAEKLEQAKAAFNMGAQLYAARKYVAAIQNFEEAYRLAPRPALLFSIAQAERRQYFESRQIDYLRRAIAHYNAYIKQPDRARLAEANQALLELEQIAGKLDPSPPTTGPTPAPPPPPAMLKPILSVMATKVKGARIVVDGKQADEGLFSEEVSPGKHQVKVSADGFFDDEREVTVQNTSVGLDIELKPRPPLLQFETIAGAQISVNGRFVGVTPLPAAISDVPPGTHVVTVTKNGYEAFSTEVDLERGESRTIKAPLRRTTQRVVAYSFLGASGVSLLAGGAFSLLALKNQSTAEKINNDRGTRNISPDDLQRYNDARDARDKVWRPAAIGAFGAAAGLGILGALLYTFDQPSVSAPARSRETQPRPSTQPTPGTPAMDISAAPSLGPGWWGVSASGSF